MGLAPRGLLRSRGLMRIGIGAVILIVLVVLLVIIVF